MDIFRFHRNGIAHNKLSSCSYELHVAWAKYHQKVMLLSLNNTHKCNSWHYQKAENTIATEPQFDRKFLFTA